MARNTNNTPDPRAAAKAELDAAETAYRDADDAYGDAEDALTDLEAAPAEYKAAVRKALRDGTDAPAPFDTLAHEVRLDEARKTLRRAEVLRRRADNVVTAARAAAAVYEVPDAIETATAAVTAAVDALRHLAALQQTARRDVSLEALVFGSGENGVGILAALPNLLSYLASGTRDVRFDRERIAIGR
ncbi:hypothetical protein [Dactylosporangium sp. NPDC005555]|uniref:hypothetical protein n=1 Tax=Dactylosporangium sp. NPDC005555 TaxID=3154889 RepID=UPI0033A5F7EF